MRIHRLAIAALAGCLLAGSAAAQAPAGFYGGVTLREAGAGASGIAFGPRVDAVAPAPTPVEDATVRQRVFGGYQWRNDIAVEATFARSESYALRPFGVGAPGGVGLTFATPQDTGARAAWNVDVVGSYTFLRAFALYGRVGYAQEVALPAATANLLTGDLRRPRDGMNYGLGMRYDVTRALGVNLEYTRFGRIGFESYGSTLPENDQVRLGVQFRF
jgi:opacity protein-like surface antigen